VKVDDPNGSGKKISLDQRETILLSDLGLDRFCLKQGGHADCQPSLHTLYEKIASRAPRALIIVTLYPHLFTNNPAPGGCNLATSKVHISQANIKWLNVEADKLDAKIIAEVKLAQGHGIDIRWIDPRAAWGDTASRASIGGHGVCTRQPWLYGPKIPLVYSFHPTSQGQAQFASEILHGKLTR
jgi:hypothetical protein